MEGQSVADTVISAASQEKHALAFNYASQALNNSFFLECLVCCTVFLFFFKAEFSYQCEKRPPPPPPATNEDNMLQRGSDLMTAIRTHFGSLAQFQSTFSAAAMGMINSGWVWLVSDENGFLEVAATFGAGTLLVRSRTHMRTADLPILGEPLESRYRGLTVLPKRGSSIKSRPTYQVSSRSFPGSGHSGYPAGPTSSTASRSYTSYSDPPVAPNIFSGRAMTPTSQASVTDRQLKDDEIGDILTPLLCVSVQEHAWIGGGYGVWGKEEYLKQFWTVVNWERVERALHMAQQTM